MALVSIVSVIKYNNNTLHVGKCINSSKDKYVIKIPSYVFNCNYHCNRQLSFDVFMHTVSFYVAVCKSVLVYIVFSHRGIISYLV